MAHLILRAADAPGNTIDRAGGRVSPLPDMEIRCVNFCFAVLSGNANLSARGARCKPNYAEAADILGVNRRRHGDLIEMLRALTLYPWLNTAEDEKRRVATWWVLIHFTAARVLGRGRRMA